MKTPSLITSLINRVHAMGSFLFHHSAMIYFVLFVCMLIGAIGGLNLILSKPSDDVYRAKKLKSSQSTRFDEATIEKVQSLNAKQQTTTDTLPAGQRTNPFGE